MDRYDEANLALRNLRKRLKSVYFGVPVAAHADALATNFPGITDANHNTPPQEQRRRI